MGIIRNTRIPVSNISVEVLVCHHVNLYTGIICICYFVSSIMADTMLRSIFLGEAQGQCHFLQIQICNILKGSNLI